DTMDFELINSDSKDFIIDRNDIAIIHIDNLESNLLSKLIDLRTSLSNRIIFIIPDGKTLLISTLVKLGFTDIFVFPFESLKLTSYLSDLIEKYKIKLQNELLGTGSFKPNFFSIPASSPTFNKIYDVSRKVAKNPSLNVLIMGETGTGKGLLAKTIHQLTFGNDAPFVDVLCTAIPENLLESELFGHEKGAFTNAQSRKLGLFELAENGTLFLDEIGDLSYNLQSKLLRAIEKKVIRRLGGLYDIPINTRILSATNKDLAGMVEDNLFRRDLYYRLNVVSIDLPPLRDRGKDVIHLTKYFIKMFNKQFGTKVRRLDKDVEKFILSYNWPGNVRELRNAIERAVLLGSGANLKLKHFSRTIESLKEKAKILKADKNIITIAVDYNSTPLKKLDKIYAEQIISKMDGNKSSASRILGISRPSLDALIK